MQFGVLWWFIGLRIWLVTAVVQVRSQFQELLYSIGTPCPPKKEKMKICSSVAFSIFTELCKPYHNQLQNIFVTSERNFIPIGSRFINLTIMKPPPHFFPPARQPLIYFLSVKICLFHINGIIQSVVICQWSFTQYIFEAHECHSMYENSPSFFYLFIFFVFLLFLGPLPRHMEVPRLGV